MEPYLERDLASYGRSCGESAHAIIGSIGKVFCHVYHLPWADQYRTSKMSLLNDGRVSLTVPLAGDPQIILSPHTRLAIFGDDYCSSRP